jgi:hypothetical protein
MSDEALALSTIGGLIGAIYDCAIEADRWPDALRQLCDFV